MQRWIWVLWPGFLVAIPAVGVMFTLVDPADVHLFGRSFEGSRLGAYTMGFLFLWAFGAACSALTCLLQQSPFEVNRCPLEQESRPLGCSKREGGSCG